ncbi:Polyketide cyclase / dehydrase and lipid transport [Actinomadura rubteroloni]|uniref:Polyketide cyclase / dehydrase and lipid transport n=1 Tax=Actinomadura rubteroloni TaxID=1926885 RepID=A0A2P4UBQ1_9ACTN|nr:SRPBCC family protein [Actinomadura rubteroloni]POM22480.1 Polyketide cyclase / dehydrase and lipid transport [Actinomadura rubteroloni]
MMIRNLASVLDDIPRMSRHIRIRRPVRATPDRLFEIIATGENQAAWAEGYRRTTWHTPVPHGVGTVRDIHLRWISVRERMLAWEPGARFAFSSDAMTLPLTRRLIEDIRFRPSGDGHADLDWQVHYTPSAPFRPLSGALERRMFRPMFESFANGLAAYAEAHPRLT